jgi:GAF domain-containing protein
MKSKEETYDTLVAQLADLLDGESDLIANAANVSAFIFQHVKDLNWAGFYLLRNGELVLGPFQGSPACTRINTSKGVCGTAVTRRDTVVVPDVRNFPSHIACDPASRSEIVVPLLVDGRVRGVLDVDSPVSGRFDEVDAAGMEQLVGVFLQKTAIN